MQKRIEDVWKNLPEYGRPGEAVANAITLEKRIQQLRADLELAEAAYRDARSAALFSIRQDWNEAEVTAALGGLNEPPEFKLIVRHEDGGPIVDTFEGVRAADLKSNTFSPAIALWLTRTLKNGERQAMETA